MPESEQLQQRPRTLLFVLGSIIALALIISLVVAVNQPPTATPTLFVQPTFDPTARANLTALPNAPVLSDGDLRLLAELRSNTQACADFSPERRNQVLQHITWLENPQQIPPDVAFALTMGGTINGRLIYGMAIFTSTEWRLLERPAESCLIDIGVTLNGMLIAIGEAPITIYDE